MRDRLGSYLLLASTDLVAARAACPRQPPVQIPIYG